MAISEGPMVAAQGEAMMVMGVRALRPHLSGEIEYLDSNNNNISLLFLLFLFIFLFHALFFYLRHWVVHKNIFIF